MTELRGPAEADNYRVKTGRFGERFYTDPLPADETWPETSDDDVHPAVSTVKKATGQDWSRAMAKRLSKAPSQLAQIAAIESEFERKARINLLSDAGLDDSSGRGKIVHSHAEARLANRMAIYQLSDVVVPYIRTLDAFFDAYQPTLVAVEFVAMHRDLNAVGMQRSGYVGYGGTADAVVEIEGKRYLVDWKGLSLDTPIPTPTGWTTMGALAVGDQVFGADGKPTTVTAKSEVHWNPCYRLTFDDASTLVADEDHRWQVRAGKPCCKNYMEGVLTTAEIADRLAAGDVVRIDNPAPLDLPDADLPVDPYVLGVWLGDGAKRDGTITKPVPELFKEIGRRGYKVSEEYASHRGTHNVYGLKADLDSLGVLNNKHVPDVYLRASRSQRLDLLRGLCDSDGSWNTTRHLDKGLAEAVYELAVSLGWRAYWFEGPARGFGLTVWRYRVTFHPLDTSAFLARNRYFTDVAPQRSRQRVIRSVESMPVVATQCITVAADDELYLAGRQMVPTHNSRAEDSAHKAYAEEGAQVSAYGRAQYWIVGTDENVNGAKRIAPLDLDGGLIVSIKPDSYECYPIDLDKGFDYWTDLHAWWQARRSETKSIGRKWAPRAAVTSELAPEVLPPSEVDMMNEHQAEVQRRQEQEQRNTVDPADDGAYTPEMTEQFTEAQAVDPADAEPTKDGNKARFEALSMPDQMEARAAFKRAGVDPRQGDRVSVRRVSAILGGLERRPSLREMQENLAEEKLARAAVDTTDNYLAMRLAAEGGEASDEMVNETRLKFEMVLTDQGREWTGFRVKEANDADMPIRLSLLKSVKRAHIYAALCDWAAWRGDRLVADEVDGNIEFTSLLNLTFGSFITANPIYDELLPLPLGHRLALLSAEDARAFALLVTEVVESETDDNLVIEPETQPA